MKKIINKQNFIITSVVLSLTMLTFFNLSLFFYAPRKPVEAMVDNSASEVLFWENFLEIHPTYFQGWIELSKLYQIRGNENKAVAAYQKAFNIEPNSGELIQLRKNLNL